MLLARAQKDATLYYWNLELQGCLGWSGILVAILSLSFIEYRSWQCYSRIFYSNLVKSKKSRIFSHIEDTYKRLSLYFLSSVKFSRSVVSNSLRPHESQHARPPCPSPTPGVHSDSCPWVSDAIQPSHPLSCPSPPAPSPSQHQSLFQWVNSLHEVAKVLKFQL